MNKNLLLIFLLIVTSITKAQVPVANFTISGSSCAGYSLHITDLSTNSPTAWSYTMSGGTPTMSSVQNPIVTYFSPGTYSIILIATNASGPSIAVTKTIAIGSSTNTAANTGPYCVGTTIQLYTPPAASYTWTGPYGFTSNLQNPTIANATMAMSGVYSVTVTTGSCISYATTSVSINPLPTPAFYYNIPVCSGQPLNIVGSGGTTYTWNGPGSFTSNSSSPIIASATASNSGTYSLTVMAPNSCTAIISANIVVNSSPTILASSASSLICGPPFQQTVTLTASGASTYTWNTSVTGNTISVSPSVTTTYSVTGTDSNGCDNTAIFTQSVSACTSVNNVGENIVQFEVYPNPSSGKITVTLEKIDKSHIEIYNSIGQLVYQQKIESKESLINERLSSGTYLLKIIDGNSVIGWKKIVVIEK